MRIEGAGGCFDDRIYELDMDTAWKLVLHSLSEIAWEIDDVDIPRHMVYFHDSDKKMQVCVQPIDDETVHIIMDSMKDRIQIYSWKDETGQVKEFYSVFEKKMRQLSASIICASCGAKISATSKFCPECGARV